MLIDRIKELNDTLYKAFAELHTNDQLINNPKHKAGIADKIYELYELDYKLIRGEMTEEDKRADEIEIEREARKEELKRRKAILTPLCERRRILFWKYRTNRAEDLYEGEACLKAEKFLNSKAEALVQLQEAIRAADEAEPSETFEEPVMTKEERREMCRIRKAEHNAEQKAERAAKKEAKQTAKAERKKKREQGEPTEPAPQENAATPE